ncbi:hypothetical protein NE237_003964 [Protea cynaroides]|uniref:Disease resistance RPP13-like protein 1 n=1 Tax=Protea cynaroides TaxID=273540 RepID=A0A9Q0KI26_9MAGN|nr:hypothetical protein NE237_003964 [Protea cynaroides]
MSSMGQLIGGSFLQVAFDRFYFPELKSFIDRWNIDLAEVESLKRTSAKIQAFSNEAEMKRFTNDAVKLWLHDVKQVLYDAEDTLDEFATELLRLKLESEYQTHSHQIQQKSGTDSTCNIVEELEGIEGLKSKIRDLNKKLEFEAQEGVALGLNSGMASESSKIKVYSQKSSSVVNISEVFGRKDEKDEIVKWLFKTPSSCSENNFSVLSIVGTGGAGKTTLAKLVYNDEIVENSKYFDLKAWVCVSDDFDEARLTKEILDSATKSSSHSSHSLDMLQVKLKELLSRKRFLLVLDDMWNDDYEKWYALTTPFAVGKSGSKILVTTRNKQVSSIVRTDPNDHDHDLKGLSDDYCFALFKKHAFVDGNSSNANQKLDEFGQKIVKKCKGLPLAVKTLACLLRVKRDNWEWEEILENEIWDLMENKNNILPSLMLSYHHLPPLLKRCLEYCALFPKDYVFSKKYLVMLWMAEGFVLPNPKGKKRLEEIGGSYFDELFMRSFFELSLPSDYWISYEKRDVLFKFHDKSFFESSSMKTGSTFVMHDLIHDLASFVSDGVYCRREWFSNNSSQVRKTTRHSFDLPDNFTIKTTEYKVMKKLRTIIVEGRRYCMFHQFPIKFQFLRVLRVTFRKIHELPNSIGKLKQLRLLDLSFCSIQRLPGQITTLYNLQTLILTGCSMLMELPKDIGNLVNLRHLFLPTDDDFKYNCVKIPSGVRNLTGLQTLNHFTASPKNSSVLRDSSQLRGSLEILELENFGNINGTEAVVDSLYLKNKPHILGLKLCWSYDRGENCFDYLGRDVKVEDEKVLDQLKPHTNLEALWIINYYGTRFPRWMEHPFSFSNLEVLCLLNCSKCRFLPHLSQLPLLKHLMIQDSSVTQMVGSELYQDGWSSSSSSSVNIKQFRSLESLHIEKMNEWEEWAEVDEVEGGQFPCLRNLIIEECPKLRMFSHRFPSLVTLRIQDCGNLRELPWLLPSLLELSISHCPKLVMLPSLPYIERLHLEQCYQISTLFDSNHHPSLSSTSGSATRIHNSFSYLQELNIQGCPAIVSFPETGLYTMLQKLSIKDCKNLELLPNELHTLRSLQEFVIETLPAILSFPKIGLSTVLQKLIIKNCKNLKSLPKELHTLTSLQKFIIKRCPALVSFQVTRLPIMLQKLEIRDCNNLESLPNELHTLTSLQKFVIKRCHALVSFQVTRLPIMLQKLEIRKCKILESLPNELHTLTSLQELKIESLPALVSFQVTRLPIVLQKLEISYCKNLESLPNEFHTLTSLQEFIIKSCPALAFQVTRLPIMLQKLEITNCKNLESLPKELHTLTSLQEFIIESLPALVSFQVTRLPIVLQKLEISDCQNLESLPNELHTLRFLQKFVIKSCPTLVSFQVTRLPIMLQKLEITDCKNLESLPKEFHTLTSLQEFKIKRLPALVSFQVTRLPIVLQKLEISDCKNLESLPKELHTLTSLQELKIESLPALVSFQVTRLPIVLQKLEISDCKNLESLPKELHTLMSLQEFVIQSCPALVSLWVTGSPTTLQKLVFRNYKYLGLLGMGLQKLTKMKNEELIFCGLRSLTALQDLDIGELPSLISIPKGMLPTNLQHFTISNCPILESLHDGLSHLTSLESLYIYNCPMIRQRYHEEGEEWSKILQTVTVCIDC